MPNILIVDDNAAFRKMLNHILVSKFPTLTVREANEGKTALETIRSQFPQIIFMDVHLPDESGFELARRLKKDYFNIIIIIMTSYDSLEYQKAAYESGADSFLSKRTSTPDDIVEKVRPLFHGT